MRVHRACGEPNEIKKHTHTRFLSRCSVCRYSQECEHEADAFGLNILARACYDVEKGSLFFKRLDKLEHDLNPLSEMTELDHARNVSESQQWSLSQMYSTHPVTANRIEELDTLAERIKHRSAPSPRPLPAGLPA